MHFFFFLHVNGCVVHMHSISFYHNIAVGNVIAFFDVCNEFTPLELEYFKFLWSTWLLLTMFEPGS